MNWYAISIKEIHEDIVIVEANSLDEAIKMTEDFNQEVGFDLEEITDVKIEKSMYANEDGTATETQINDGRGYTLWNEQN